MSRRSIESRMLDYATRVFGLFLLSGLALLNAALIMLALGVAHGHWPTIPPLGFWATYLLTLGIGALAGTIKGGLKFEPAEDGR